MAVFLPSRYRQLPDVAYDETEEILAEIIAEIESVYGQAYTELKGKSDEYLQWFAGEDAKKRKQWQDGIIDTAEYRQWRQGKLLTGMHWYAMSETIAQDLANRNGIAYSIINDYIPEVYAINGNWATYQIEHQTKINTSFELFDEQTIERLIRDKPNLLPKASVNVPLDMRWNKQNLTSAVMQSIIQGERVEQLAERLASVTDMNQSSSIRNAKTMVTSAQNGGRQASYERAETFGIKGEKIWVATLDGHTRAEHRALDGVRIGIHERFSNGLMFPGDPDGDPASVYNCFVGDTKIASNSEIVRSYKCKYEGDIISIKTAGGVEFSCTPNHPILTLRGWIPVKLFNKGDDILVAFGIDKELFRFNPNINHAFPRIDAIHNFFNKFGSKRTCFLGVNFHGDIPTSDVEIVTQKRLLRKSSDSSVFNRFCKFLFVDTNKSFVSKRSFMKHFRSVWFSSFRNVCSMSKFLPIFKRSLRHSKIHGLRPVALFYPDRIDPADNSVSGNVELLRKCLNGFTGVVFSDKIVNVDVNSCSTHVYNLQTENGYYFVNSIIPQKHEKVNGIFAIAHNCRCRMIEVFKDQDFSQFERSNRLGDISYEEWKTAHGGEPLFKAARNVNRDYDMMREYKSLLGKRVPTNIKDFRDIKYNHPDEWKKMVSDARKARNKRRKKNGG